ncbi:MAG TPA: hypothetical protein VLF21_02570 [Candidatus Saccharimonadales bacterium]|nr:hypothetical protein [Candidatus Saccharimonadales bacterium]
MSEQLSDPMPEDPRERREVYEMMGKMSEREDEEIETVMSEQAEDETLTSAEIVEDRGGPEEMERLVGTENLKDLVDSDEMERQRLLNTMSAQENQDSNEIVERRQKGATHQDILDEYGGVEGLARKIGADAAQRFADEADRHSPEEMSKMGELNSLTELVELQAHGMTDEQILDKYGFDELERMVGTETAKSYVEGAKKEQEKK